MAASPDALEKLQRTDHDTLIRLETKVDALILVVNEMKDGTQSTLANHEARIKAIEQVHEKVDPIAAVELLKKLDLKVHDFQLTWRFIVTVAAITGSVVTFLLKLLGDYFHIFG